MKKKTKKWTLYLLTFPDGMQYVGITRQNLKDRIDRGRGYKGRKSMMRTVASYGGWKNVKEEPLRTGIATKREAGARERLEIAKRNTLWPFGYNRQDGGFVGVHTFAENSYPIKQIDPVTGEMVKMWRSAALAEDCGKGKDGQKLQASHIRECVNGIKSRKYPGGYDWKKATWEEYKDYYTNVVKPSFPAAIHFS